MIIVRKIRKMVRKFTIIKVQDWNILGLKRPRTETAGTETAGTETSGTELSRDWNVRDWNGVYGSVSSDQSYPHYRGRRFSPGRFSPGTVQSRDDSVPEVSVPWW